MRTSIKVISFIITLSIFLILNFFWFAANPGGESLETDNPAFFIVLIFILGAILIIAVYFYVNSRQKTKLKLM